MDEENCVESLAGGLSENVAVSYAIEIGSFVLDSGVVGGDFVNHVGIDVPRG